MHHQDPDEPWHTHIAHASEVARTLDEGSIHVWSLPRQHADGRQPLLALLASYLDTQAINLKLRIHAHGRPALEAPHAVLDFNWSHSGTQAVVVLARHLPQLGVDIEYPKPRRDVLALARRFFAPSEQQLLESLSASRRHEVFLQLWTAKEAVLKAHGHGLAYGLERVAFTLDKDGIRAAQFSGEIGSSDAWQLRHWPVSGDGHVTLAWQGSDRRILHFAFTSA